MGEEATYVSKRTGNTEAWPRPATQAIPVGPPLNVSPEALAQAVLRPPKPKPTPKDE
jgi:hypothetical protein